MRRFSIICLAGLTLIIAPLAAQAASHDPAREPNAAREPKTEAARKTPGAKKAGGAFLAKPVEPAPAPEEKPDAAWSGFYFGLNGGAANNR